MRGFASVTSNETCGCVQGLAEGLDSSPAVRKRPVEAVTAFAQSGLTVELLSLKISDMVNEERSILMKSSKPQLASAGMISVGDAAPS